MDNQHKMIAGYRDLSAEEIALVNDIKALADKVGALFESLDYCASTDKRCDRQGVRADSLHVDRSGRH